jgi:TraX protein
MDRHVVDTNRSVQKSTKASSSGESSAQATYSGRERVKLKRKRNARDAGPYRLAAPGFLRLSLLGNLAPSSASEDGLDAAKIAAIFLMTINHVLLAFPDWRLWGYLIGRPCIPIFAFIIVARLANGPPDRGVRMLVRLICWGIVAQVPYYPLFGAFPPHLNILFTLAAGVGLIHLARRGPQLLLAPVALVIALVGHYLDGGSLTPISMLAGFLLFYRSKVAALSLLAAGVSLENMLGPLHWVAVTPTLVAVPIVLASSRLISVMPRQPGVTFYIFYPTHLLVIWLLLGPYSP